MAIINGTAGNDSKIGTSGADTINGFAGNDTVTGAEGNDLALMGAGNDIFIWRSGDGDDRVRGQDGFDTLVFEASGLGDLIGIRNLSHVGVFEAFGNAVDLDDVERIIVRALAGSDGIFIDNFAGTDVQQVLVDLASTPGGKGGDGEVDGVVRNGGSGNDIINVALVSGAVSITGSSPQVTIRNADSDDILELNGLEGNDTINASKVSVKVMQLAIDGGTGNDIITGSAGNDKLDGGDGNDVVTGGRGNDTVDLGAGNDLFVWRGDGVDTVNGGDGIDTLLMAGSGGKDTFYLFANGALFNPSISVNSQSIIPMVADKVERIQVRALAGADIIHVQNLSGTYVSAVDIDLAATISGTLPDADVDLVSLSPPQMPGLVQVASSVGKIVVTGLPATVSIAHAGANDQLAISGGGGNDIVDASALAAGKISLRIFANDGDDVIFGSAGDDIVSGGNGNDIAYLGSGNDTFNGDPGNDVVNMGDGNDRCIYVYGSFGNGNDTVIGGNGIDTFDYRNILPSPSGDGISIEAEAGRVRISRVFAEVISLSSVERLQVLLGDRDDILYLQDLTGTSMKLVAIDLAATSGSVVGDGFVDSVSVAGTAGNDLITIGAIPGGLSITGLPAQVTIIHADNGGPSDRLFVVGGDGNDTINATAMPAVMTPAFYGNNGNDRILGGAGAEEIKGGGGNDTLSGGSNHDILSGDAGNDFLDGGLGRDSLDGGTGNDVLVGGRGNDEITCGDGADRIRYTSVLDGHDVILDFDGDPTGGQDVLDLDALFDSLGIAASKRAALVNINDLGSTVEISVNVDGKPGFELLIATLHTVDVITKGQDVIVGT